MADQLTNVGTRLLTRLLISLFTFMGLVIAGFILYSISFISGTEFSPDDFTRRSFDYQKLPGLNWILAGIEYNDITNDFEKSLISDGLIKSRTQTDQTWHLCGENQRTQPAECDARFLVHHLTLRSNNTEFQFYWEWWNDTHPDLAKIFWPEIAQMARDEMYLAIPEVMEMGMSLEHRKNKPDADEFADQLYELIATCYQKFGDIDQANGKNERAKQRLDRAQEYLSR